MSGLNRTLALTMCDLDETDLCLDLDDHNDIDLTKSKQDIAFKKPAIELLSETDRNKNDELNADDDLKVFKKFEPQNQSIFEELFHSDNEEDDEDELLKNQPILSSTQFDSSTQKTLPKKSDNFEFKKPSQVFSKINSIQSERRFDESVPSQQTFRVTQPVENETESGSRGAALLNILTDNKVWNYALKDLRKEFQLVRLDSQLIQNYTINYYFKKVNQLLNYLEKKTLKIIFFFQRIFS